jgi:myo-inositol 2-dehydrogenase/D-chiro-inositol 1-dehydrogenase
MSNRPLRIVILGAGRIGSLHGEIVAHETPGAQLVGVSDISSVAASTLGQRLSVPVMTLDEALSRSDVDAVAVCTSTDTHVDTIRRVAHAGKAIFCEKPISLDLARVDEALAAVDECGVPFMVGFNRRFDPSHQAVRDAVIAGDVGEVHVVRITSRDPAPPPLEYIKVSGGIFLDMTVHDFDMARFLTGSEVVEVFAQAATRVDPAIGESGDFDTVVVNLRHADGALSVIDNSRQAVYGYDQRVEVFGSRGVAASQNWRLHSAVTMGANGGTSAPLQNFFLERYRQSYQREWRSFVDAVTNGSPLPVTGADGRAPLVLGIAARMSVESGRTIAVSEVT